MFTGAWLATARDLRPRWWLVPVTWLWACSHGMWFTGALVGVAVVLGLCLERRVTVRQAIQLGLVPTVSVIFAALTPVGPRLLLAPLSVRGYAQFVSEWAAPQLTEPQSVAALGMAAIVVITWVRSGQKLPWHRIMVLAIGVGWALLYARTVAIGAAMIAPLFAQSLQTLLSQARPAFSRRERTLVAGITAISLVAAAVFASVGPSAPSATKFPTKLDAELSALPAGTVILDEYVLGGWLLWRHPDLQPVIDGRTEVYSVPYVRRYVNSQHVAKGWDGFVRSSNASVALVAAGSPLATALVQRLHWRPNGTDAGYIFLVAPAVSHP